MTMAPVTIADRFRYMQAGLRSAGVAILYQDLDLTIRFTANLPQNWPDAAAVEGKSDDVLFTEKQARRVIEAKRQVLASREPATLEILREIGQNRHWFMLSIEPDIATGGEIVGLVTTILDINDIKYRETVLKTLLRELSHRSKNLLAIIQSIASQTARSTDDLDAFLRAFRNRVHAMAQSQDLVTASDWRGAELFALMKSQLQPLIGDLPDGFKLVGKDPYLLPNAALHLGLALHELTIDSLARGALGPAGGNIRLSADMIRNDHDQPELIVTWTETFATPVDKPADAPRSSAGFSGTVLGRIVPQALSASLRHEADEDRMVYQLTIPESQYESSSRH